MTIHKEGFVILTVIFLILIGSNAAIYFFMDSPVSVLKWTILLSSLLFVFFAAFFRSPKRSIYLQDKAIISPADGKIVVIEETEENEFLKDKCIQVSVFMSVFNVHINWFPISGIIRYVKHHSGRFKAAYLPKASFENERTTIAIETKEQKNIVVRQVAGALARRIVCYAKEGESVTQGQQLGFIKFGSRVDIFLPLDSRIDVKPGQKVKGKQTIIGWID
ncbi:phosphatidylserine decarboxylase family protein [Thermophagus xiamenensis]|jgi:phosphatidylserine decarboxylase|uniref:Phosphatidylserine decarboxylase proenzyme n=1 Tax=Thermophagus xiamenensis TaxID=385682 RepID=A0A1I1UKX4_9BACT|nr:phosphatidylserine decarboxylase family protein [Thermophagus xiamenensis]SFD71354.1 phosphatidylserine decarboxylase [Thermophagus xiamenensis]